MSVFDQISDRPYLMVERDTPTPVSFDEDEPVATTTNRYGAQQYDFNVNGDRILGISSKPFMRALKPFTPLGGKTIVITKSGHGFETTYTVEEVPYKKHWQTKLLTRLCGMMRAAIALLWVLRELLG
jgi:hypothetical protein